MSRSFNQQLDQHGVWRRNVARRLEELSGWLGEHDLLDLSVAERLRELETQLRTSKVMVAFVAEFSRGKSELINAIFFAGYGRRIMPASAGRTTMCPTELGYDADQPPSLRLLPIETRLESFSLMHWREEPSRWTDVPIDVDDADRLVESMSKVSSMVSFSPSQLMIARSLEAVTVESIGPTTPPHPHAATGPTAEVARSASVTKPTARTRRMPPILPEAERCRVCA